MAFAFVVSTVLNKSARDMQAEFQCWYMHDSIFEYHLANQKLKAVVGVVWYCIMSHTNTNKTPQPRLLHLYRHQGPSSRFRFEQPVTTCVDEADEDSSDELECRRA